MFSVDTLINVAMLVAGFVLLIKGADVFVEGASKIAAMLKIPQIVIGLTIVAFGTSAPEAAVSIASAFKGTAGIAIGNIIGSNICNVLLILGAAGTIGALSIKKNTLKIETPYVILISVILLALGNMGGGIDKIDAAILWGFFLLFLYYLYRLTLSGEEAGDDIPELEEDDKLWKLLVMIVLGMAAIVAGSQLTVDGASNIAIALGVSDRIIGLTIVAIGTSLPELVTSVNASLKGKTDIAIGNVIGSNIFNILFVLGTAGLVSPTLIAFDPSFMTDGIISIAAIVAFMLFIGKDMKLRKAGAIIMLVSYFVYVISIL